ncbi:hypothetical protein J23TS9_02110 [Paenibacillus sp. J23TS9]|uniref:zf-HC2 domain-containing protein n=1 Tax=Paenibacillus sp. J23TS9 TaxID=2807193 RepID=UPI001B0F1569|nr:zf-HC2 domain-containing protein [Paenibacillus sp. J23TS9]GIP25081.1 hypothetical protein J23TS9_02110 [Paenibacillus sp. J23TS9]
MKCPEVVEWMHRYLDYDLSEEETVQLYEHLKQCPECTDTFRMLKSLSRDLEDLPKVTPKFSIVDAIMPQLDAIDQARQEKSASREEAPAEMVPVPTRPVRTSKFRNSVAGRTAMGAVAAVIILGVAIYNYSPKHLSTAEEPAFKAEQKMAETASSASESTTGSGGGQQDVKPKQDEQQSDPVKQDTTDGSSAGSGDAELTTPDVSADHASKDQTLRSTEPPVKPDDKTSRSADTGIGKKSASGGAVDSGTPAESSNPEQGTPVDNGNGGSSQDNKAADNSSTPETPAADSNSKDQDPGVKEDNMTMGITSFNKAAAAQFNSPDGKYAASVEEKKLVIYNVSDKDGQKTAVKTIDLPGTWVSGVWSADSTVFTYQTSDDQGATTSKTYQVNGSDSSNP